MENGLQFNQTEGHEPYCVGIAYKAGADAGLVAGKSFTAGRPEIKTLNGQQFRVVTFKEKYKNQTVHLRCDSRPDLAAFADAYEAEIARRNAADKAAWQARAERMAAQDAPLLAAMRAEVEVLIAQIPAHGVRVIVTQTGSADGDPIYDYEAEGVKLSWQDIIHVGSAHARRDQTLSAFASELVDYISRERLEQIRIGRQASVEAGKVQRAERRRDLTETTVPASALAAYKTYGGDDEAAWDAGDESAWSLIREWGDHIEAQDLLPLGASAVVKMTREDDAELVRAMIGEDA